MQYDPFDYVHIYLSYRFFLELCCGTRFIASFNESLLICGSECFMLNGTNVLEMENGNCTTHKWIIDNGTVNGTVIENGNGTVISSGNKTAIDNETELCIDHCCKIEERLDCIQCCGIECDDYFVSYRSLDEDFYYQDRD